MKLLLVFVMAFLLLQVSVEANDNAATSLTSASVSCAFCSTKNFDGWAWRFGGALHKKINCGKACGGRCKKSSRKKVCHRACKSCCNKCGCVPPGTYGHHSSCPCYASLRTHRNKLKCP